MSAARSADWSGRDADVASIAVAAIGCGAVLVLAGLARRDLMLAAAGAALAAAALVWLLATRPAAGLLLLAASLPLPAIFSTTSLRFTLAAPLTALVVMAWGLGYADPRRRLRTGALPAGATLAVLGAFALGTVFAVDLTISIRETLNFAVLIALLFAATDIVARDRSVAGQLVGALTAIGAACGVLAVLESLGALPGSFPRRGTDLYRAALGFGQPNGLGLFLAVLLPLALGRAGEAVPGRRAPAIAAALLIALGLFATFSRGAWLALLAGSAVLPMVGARRRFLNFWIAALLLAVAVDVASGGALRETARNTIGDWVIEQRAALMAAGLLMFRMHPWTGVGPGGFEASLDRVGAAIPALTDYLPTPHNVYIQMAAETGIFGFIALIAFFGVVLRRLLRGARAAPPGERSLRVAVLWSFSTVVFAGMVIWPFAHGAGQAVVLVAALGFARPAGERTP